MMRLFYCLLFIVLISSGCTDHRNLHVDAKPMFIIKNDWSESKLAPESATVMLFHSIPQFEPMYNNALIHRLYLEPKLYDLLVFNEAMFSPSETNLEGIAYRGTEGFNTFGAYAKPSSVNSVFKSAPDEIMVGYGYPVPLAAAKYDQKEILGSKQYILKYEDGKNGFPVYSDFDADSVDMLPIRVTREVKVIAHIKNFREKSRVSCVLRGFAEGVLLSSRQPDGGNAAYVFDLNSARPDPEVEAGYIVVSKPFATFGPWWSSYPSDRRRYVLDFVVANGEILNYSFDVTEYIEKVVTRSVGEAIIKIKAEEAKFLADGTIPKLETIIIEVWFELPPIEGDGSLDVGVGDWGSDIIVSVPI